jgi:hypothetical protein
LQFTAISLKKHEMVSTAYPLFEFVLFLLLNIPLTTSEVYTTLVCRTFFFQEVAGASLEEMDSAVFGNRGAVFV